MNKRQKVLLYVVAAIQIIMTMILPYRYANNSILYRSFLAESWFRPFDFDVYLMQYIMLVTLGFIAYKLMGSK
jgi:hypothetical protein